MRRNASMTHQQRGGQINRPIRRTPSSTGMQRRTLTRPGLVPPIRIVSLTDDPTPSTREFQEIEQEIQQEDSGAEHDKKVLEVLNNIHEGVKGSIDASCKGQGEIVSLIKEIKECIDVIKTHTPRKNPECEVEMRDLLIDVKDELKGLRKDVCGKGNEAVNAVSNMQKNINTTSSIPLHRRNSENKIASDVVGAIRDLQSVIETPRGGDRRGSGGDDQHEITREMRDLHCDQMVTYNSSIDKIVTRFDELLSMTKEGKEISQMRKQQETVLLTEIKEALDKRADLLVSDYEDKYIHMKSTHENQFYKFSKILAMYHAAMLKLCRSDNPEAEEEFIKLSELVGTLTDEEPGN